MKLGSLRFAASILALTCFLSLSVVVPTDHILAQDGSWVTKAPMPTPRFASVAATIGGILYVVGGNK